MPAAMGCQPPHGFFCCRTEEPANDYVFAYVSEEVEQPAVSVAVARKVVEVF
jgi:hypothetical protein